MLHLVPNIGKFSTQFFVYTQIFLTVHGMVILYSESIKRLSSGTKLSEFFPTTPVRLPLLLTLIL